MDAAGWPSVGSTVPTIAPVDTSAISTRPGPEAAPTPPGEVLVKAIRRPSGESSGSVSQSFGPRPARFIGFGSEPSAPVCQIRSIRPAGESSKRVSTIRRPSGV